VKVVAAASVAFLALALAPSAAGDYSLVVRQDRARPGEMVTVWGGGCFGSPARGMPMYLVPAGLMRFDAVRMRHPPDGGFYHYLGRVACTHVNEPEWLPNGWWSAGTFRFRIPRVAPGWFKIAMFCPPCHSVIAARTYFDGRRTHYIGRGLRVLAAK
jgi:hypothetical protein